MAVHSSILPWRIPGTGEPGGLPSVGSQRVGHTEVTQQQQQQFNSVVQLCRTLRDPMNHSTPGLPVHQHLPEFTQTHVHPVCDAIQPSHPQSPPSPRPPIPPSIRVFSNESTLHMKWPKYWSFSFSIIASKEIPGLISLMDWLDLLAVQGTLEKREESKMRSCR